jgi:hypothetical protein
MARSVTRLAFRAHCGALVDCVQMFALEQKQGRRCGIRVIGVE